MRVCPPRLCELRYEPPRLQTGMSCCQRVCAPASLARAAVKEYVCLPHLRELLEAVDQVAQLSAQPRLALRHLPPPRRQRACGQRCGGRVGPEVACEVLQGGLRAPLHSTVQPWPTQLMQTQSNDIYTTVAGRQDVTTASIQQPTHQRMAGRWRRPRQAAHRSAHL